MGEVYQWKFVESASGPPSSAPASVYGPQAPAAATFHMSGPHRSAHYDLPPTETLFDSGAFRAPDHFVPPLSSLFPTGVFPVSAREEEVNLSPSGEVVPKSRYGHASVLLGNGRYLVIVGGWRSPNSESHEDMWILDTTTFRWFLPRLEGTGRCPLQRGGHSATAISDTRFVVYGGQNRRAIFEDLHVFHLEFPADADDPQQFFVVRWFSPSIVLRRNIRGPKPPPRSQHFSFFYNNKVWISHGHDGFGRMHGDTWCIDLETWSLEQVLTHGAVPPPMGASAAVVAGDCVLVFGGRWHPQNFSNSLWILHLPTLTWFLPKTAGAVPSPRAAHSLVLHGHICPNCSIMHTITGELLQQDPLDISDCSSDCISQYSYSDWCERGAQRRRLMLFGGSDGISRSDEVYFLDLDTMVWEHVLPKGDIPSKRSVHTASLVGEEDACVYVWGGFNGEVCFGDLHVFSIEFPNR
eukprot:ANDGO_04463.mRNA.1 Kelch repeat-containing protein 2